MVKAIPEGYHTVTPHLCCKDAAKAIEFYAKAFGAELCAQMPDPSGKLMHAEITIGNSRVMLADEYPDMGAVSPQTLGGSASSLMIYVEDVDAAFKRATEAGATAKMPPADMFWGDRYCKLEDPFGHSWAIATHIEDVSPEQMAERAKQWASDNG